MTGHEMAVASMEQKLINNGLVCLENWSFLRDDMQLDLFDESHDLKYVR